MSTPQPYRGPSTTLTPVSEMMSPMATEALAFAEETVREAQVSRRRAWIATWVLIVICAAQAAAIALMLPLKEIVPYTILVDRQSGYMETVRGIETGALSDDRAVVESFLAQYVLQRETFDPSDFEQRYQRVALWSAEAARESYLAQFAPGQSDSTLKTLRPGSIIKVRIKRIDVTSKTSALVRFDLTRIDPGGAPTSTDWQTIVEFRFSAAPMRMEDRLINPLGFQVVRYRRDAEWVASPAPTLAPASASPDRADVSAVQGAGAAASPTVEPSAPAAAAPAPIVLQKTPQVAAPPRPRTPIEASARPPLPAQSLPSTEGPEQ